MVRRQSKQKTTIIEILKNRQDHPTADMIFSEARSHIPHISMGTVYRNLEILRSEGQVRIVSAPGQPRRFDGNTRHHYHIHCTVCGHIEDLPAHLLPNMASLTVPGYDVIRCVIELEGICPRCRSRNS